MKILPVLFFALVPILFSLGSHRDERKCECLEDSEPNVRMINNVFKVTKLRFVDYDESRKLSKPLVLFL